jgi:hypothetical protein
MKHSYPILAGFAFLLLAGCGSDDRNDGAPAIRVTDLAAGNYTVGAGDAADPTVGKYYAAADGSRLLVLNDAGDAATAIYRRDGTGPWRATGTTASLDLLGSNAVPAQALALSAIAGNYTVRLADGSAAAFSVNGAGEIVPGRTACRLSGNVTASPFQSTLKVALAAAGCGTLPAASDGYLVADGDYAPAAFRVLAYTDAAVVDLWAYKD